ncbi:glycoside hydrolase family 9 protein [Marinimicrobium sp. ARAG 43.8]|uniref:glycoside hydrolase family 9 protein n=1 Tax=Marinimicrobium sp. ARAG 43.8 TaxID=3418719 RepID=UPI003CEDDD2C
MFRHVILIRKSLVVTLFVFWGALSLVACGGSGGGGSADPAPSPGSSSESMVCGQTVPDSASAATVQSTVPVADCLVVDQFGYLPESRKVAVLRDPREGHDANLSFTPGSDYALVNVDTGEVAYEGEPSVWNSGQVSATSGDAVWWFDFSDVSTPGRYLVWDRSRNVRSPEFSIGEAVYQPVLKDAVRTLFYQRAGYPKESLYAESGWTDGTSHLGSGQDTAARRYGATGDASTERDLRGGWYDAGDYNKYTNWHADYLVVLLHSYRENPAVWGDDYNLPDSGDGIPDLLNEVHWGMEWLVRMQEDNGSVLSVMGLDHASPPSSATGPSIYGPATTSASLTSAQAFALGSLVFSTLGTDEWSDYAAELRQRALDAWTWAQSHPEITFANTGKVAAGEQEVDENGRAAKRRAAAIYLYALTGDEEYRTLVEDYYQSHPIDWVGPWNEPELMHLLYFASLDGVTEEIADNIRDDYRSAMNSNWGQVENELDAYRAYLGASDFTWGSNRTMARQGLTFQQLDVYHLDPAREHAIAEASEGYLHYLHGTNPQGLVYLSNMYHLGVYRSVDTFYHSWFSDGSPNWDSAQDSSYGPAPGFLVGGPNPGYNWDSCCPDSCGGAENNARCGSAPLSPPFGQPPAKSYRQFNDSWPLNSWEVTENHNDYQVAYIRLLSKFVPPIAP